MSNTGQRNTNLPEVPERLAALGFIGANIVGVPVILPPVVPVPAGEFVMGSDRREDPRAGERELPRHSLTLPTFSIGLYPVTVAEYACMLGAGVRPFKTWRRQAAKQIHPVTLSWRHAVEYAAWLAHLTDQSWRLPTEAEWEKAARWDTAKGHARRYPWGDEWDMSRCNSRESGLGTTVPVGSHPGGESPYGAREMAGNVLEWTSSLMWAYPYSQHDGRENPNAPQTRVVRGGSWNDDAWGVRAATRQHNQSEGDGVLIGFRLLLASTRI